MTTATKLTAAEITAKLQNFIGIAAENGNSRFKHFLGYTFSEGVKEMAELCGAYWLIDLVFSHQTRAFRSRFPVQTWLLTLDRSQPEFMAVARAYERYDDSQPKLHKAVKAQRIPYTDFPLEKIKFHFVNGHLMLESEFNPVTNVTAKPAADATAKAVSFSLGRVLATPGAMEAIEAAGQSPVEFISRHAAGDWGDVCEEDRGLNDQSLIDGSRILSVYKTKLGVKLWVLTEAADESGQRAVTTALLPSEY